ncbi:hypothetical protein GCM10017687_70010 [Streptomyces echinatus]
MLPGGEGEEGHREAEGGSASGGPTLRTLTIVDPGIRARIALARRSTGPASPAAKALLDSLRERLRERLPAVAEVPETPAG